MLSKCTELLIRASCQIYVISNASSVGSDLMCMRRDFASGVRHTILLFNTETLNIVLQGFFLFKMLNLRWTKSVTGIFSGINEMT